MPQPTVDLKIHLHYNLLSDDIICVFNGQVRSWPIAVLAMIPKVVGKSKRLWSGVGSDVTFHTDEIIYVDDVVAKCVVATRRESFRVYRLL